MAEDSAMEQREPVRRIRPEERVEADPTPGMVREEAVAAGSLWAGFVTTEAHMTSGWHHHGDHDSSIYVLDGAVRLESGPGGSDVFDAGPGDFVHVPRGAVHRESNPGDTPSHLIVSRAGSGPVTVNVDGPSPA